MLPLYLKNKLQEKTKKVAAKGQFAMSETISIIIPTLNSYLDLKLCIKSVLEQTYKEKEIIVIDGGSTDSTITYLKQISGNVKYISGSDGGIYDAMNKGIEIATGEWILFLGDDDRLINEDVLSEVFGKRFISSSVQIIYGDGICGQRILVNSFSWKLLKGNSINHQCIFYRRQAVFAQNRYDTGYLVGADYKLNLLLYKSGFLALKVPILISNFGDGGISQRKIMIGRSEENLARIDTLGFLVGTVLNILVKIKYSTKDALQITKYFLSCNKK
ncbi:glycosyltransferase family 2 protein [Cylindrospermopsis raciborskii]|uniref:glycosyltransferase family 2 protein n=1 Tax=Cylindrospermopsis raciborskii TaxID=77022 RepID=UPI0022C690A1|nr:glycosyltransferase family 2 protein [Cylindrospermopsis raciborskii]MCZ2207565.1 glycosyltransferase family 2 protein [Cylindrospermopsis raciborskii PAMP2011]